MYGAILGGLGCARSTRGATNGQGGRLRAARSRASSRPVWIYALLTNRFIILRGRQTPRLPLDSVKTTPRSWPIRFGGFLCPHHEGLATREVTVLYSVPSFGIARLDFASTRKKPGGSTRSRQAGQTVGIYSAQPNTYRLKLPLSSSHLTYSWFQNWTTSFPV